MKCLYWKLTKDWVHENSEQNNWKKLELICSLRRVKHTLEMYKSMIEQIFNAKCTCSIFSCTTLYTIVIYLHPYLKFCELHMPSVSHFSHQLFSVECTVQCRMYWLKLWQMEQIWHEYATVFRLNVYFPHASSFHRLCDA